MSEPRWLTDDEQRTWRAFLQATQMLFDQLDRELQKQHDLPHAYYEILVHLSETEDRQLRMGELAARARFSRSRLSHAVARLESQGWIERRTCAGDARGALAVLTPAGFAELQRAAPTHVEGVRSHLFDQLTQSQVDQLRQISEAITHHLEGVPTRGPEGSCSPCD